MRLHHADFHVNDIVWAYDLVNNNLTRIFSAPYGAETTSPYYYDNVKGWNYLVTVVQHPYSGSASKLADSESTGERAERASAGTGPGWA